METFLGVWPSFCIFLFTNIIVLLAPSEKKSDGSNRNGRQLPSAVNQQQYYPFHTGIYPNLVVTGTPQTVTKTEETACVTVQNA